MFLDNSNDDEFAWTHLLITSWCGGATLFKRLHISDKGWHNQVISPSLPLFFSRVKGFDKHWASPNKKGLLDQPFIWCINLAAFYVWLSQFTFSWLKVSWWQPPPCVPDLLFSLLWPLISILSSALSLRTLERR